jgi:hypothetical protein
LWGVVDYWRWVGGTVVVCKVRGEVEVAWALIEFDAFGSETSNDWSNTSLVAFVAVGVQVALRVSVDAGRS